MTENSNWHLDKKVPIGLIITIGLQIFFGVWFAAKLDSRVDANERMLLEKSENEYTKADKEFQDYKILLNVQSLDKVNAKLDQMAIDISDIKVAVSAKNRKTPELGG